MVTINIFSFFTLAFLAYELIRIVNPCFFSIKRKGAELQTICGNDANAEKIRNLPKEDLKIAKKLTNEFMFFLALQIIYPIYTFSMFFMGVVPFICGALMVALSVTVLKLLMPFAVAESIQKTVAGIDCFETPNRFGMPNYSKNSVLRFDAILSSILLILTLIF